MNETLQAAEAYLLAGQQAEKRAPGDRNQIAEYYELAQKFFKQEGEIEKQHRCLEMVMAFPKSPVFSFPGKQPKLLEKASLTP
ncbi:MAG: hypothetical protein AB9891_12900 [Anaerolineaceae bacterium]